MNLLRHGVCDAFPHAQPCLLTCIPFTHFSLGRSLKNGCASPPTLGPALPTLRSHIYCCSYAMKPDRRGANHIIVEKSWYNRKETLMISVKLQPNVIHSQQGVINVRNRISRLKKLCIIKPIWRIRHFVDQQTINEDPRLAVNIVMAYKATHASQTLHSLHVFRCTHLRLIKKEGFKSY